MHTDLGRYSRDVCMFPRHHLLCVPIWRFPGTLPVALAALLDFFGRVRANLSQNPWEHPPEPFVAGGMPAVRNYFEAIFRSGTTSVTRPLKVVIVGKETVGKTRYESSTYLVLQVCWYVRNRFCGITELSFVPAISNPMSTQVIQGSCYTAFFLLDCGSESVVSPVLRESSVSTHVLQRKRPRTNTPWRPRGTTGSIICQGF